MGRIKTQLVKRTTMELFDSNAQDFKTSFEENKTIVSGMAAFPSKKIRNTVAGYVTRLAKNRKEY